MPYTLRTNVVPGWQLYVEFDDRGASWMDRENGHGPLSAGTATGLPINPAILCTSGKITSGRRKIGSLFDAGFRYGVTARLRDAIESMEPGVHQFIPMRLSYKQGGEPEGEYFILNVCNLLDAVDPERSVMRLSRGKYWASGVRGVDPSEVRLVLRSADIAGKAIWKDRKHDDYFVSDALHDLLIDEKACKFWRVLTDDSVREPLA